jgi:hypothetical protein
VTGKVSCVCLFRYIPRQNKGVFSEWQLTVGTGYFCKSAIVTVTNIDNNRQGQG